MTEENYRENNPNKYRLSDGTIITESNYNTLLQAFTSTYNSMTDKNTGYVTDVEKRNLNALLHSFEEIGSMNLAMEFDKESRFLAYTHWNSQENKFDVNHRNPPEKWFEKSPQQLAQEQEKEEIQTTQAAIAVGTSYEEWEEMLDDNQVAEERIEQIQVDGGMSETSIQAEFTAEENKNTVEQIDKSLMTELSDVLESGDIITRTNSSLDGDVRVKRGGMKEGLVHLIDHRIRERVLNEKVQMNVEQAKKETSAVLFLAIDNIDKAPAIQEKDGNWAVYHKGIKSVITKDKKGHYVLTGYDNNKTKKEATESIDAVIAQYGNSPEFLGIYTQVGAVIASYNILPQSNEKSTVKALENKIKDLEEKLDKQTSVATSQSQLLYGKGSCFVNGVKREFENGLVNAFPEAVKRIDIENQRNKELTADYNKLLKSQNQNITPVSPTDYDTRSD